MVREILQGISDGIRSTLDNTGMGCMKHGLQIDFEHSNNAYLDYVTVVVYNDTFS